MVTAQGQNSTVEFKYIALSLYRTSMKILWVSHKSEDCLCLPCPSLFWISTYLPLRAQGLLVDPTDTWCAADGLQRQHTTRLFANLYFSVPHISSSAGWQER